MNRGEKKKKKNHFLFNLKGTMSNKSLALNEFDCNGAIAGDIKELVPLCRYVDKLLKNKKATWH